jgi:hypothetical protein
MDHETSTRTRLILQAFDLDQKRKAEDRKAARILYVLLVAAALCVGVGLRWSL